MDEEERVTAGEAATAGAKVIGYAVLILIVVFLLVSVLGAITAPLMVTP